MHDAQDLSRGANLEIRRREKKRRPEAATSYCESTAPLLVYRPTTAISVRFRPGCEDLTRLGDLRLQVLLAGGGEEDIVQDKAVAGGVFVEIENGRRVTNLMTIILGIVPAVKSPETFA